MNEATQRKPLAGAGSPTLPVTLPRPCLMLVTEPMERARLIVIVQAAVAGGADIVQIRDRAAPPNALLEIGAALRRALPQTLLVINGGASRPEARVGIGAHLPEQGGSVRQAKAILGAAALAGRSVHSVAAAQQAERDGADYLVAGTIFPSASHPDVAPAGLGFLQQVCRAVSLPVLAIGGITPDRAGDCVRAGAVGVAVLSSLMRAADPFLAARQYRLALEAAWQALPPGRQEIPMIDMIELTINGEARSLAGPMRLSDFLTENGLQEKRVVVERNREIVPRHAYAEVLLQAGDEVEIVQMMAGG